MLINVASSLGTAKPTWMVILPSFSPSLIFNNVSLRRQFSYFVYSFERVLKDLADDIGYENIETVIEKKRKAIEHISNPNFKEL